MSPWPLAIWLTCSTRTTCRPQVPCVTGVSDSAPNSSAGVASLSTWQGAWGTTVHSYIVDKETWNNMTWCKVDKVRLAIVTSVRSIHTHLVDVLKFNFWSTELQSVLYYIACYNGLKLVWVGCITDRSRGMGFVHNGEHSEIYHTM